MSLVLISNFLTMLRRERDYVFEKFKYIRFELQLFYMGTDFFKTDFYVFISFFKAVFQFLQIVVNFIPLISNQLIIILSEL